MSSKPNRNSYRNSNPFSKKPKQVETTPQPIEEHDGEEFLVGISEIIDSEHFCLSGQSCPSISSDSGSGGGSSGGSESSCASCSDSSGSDPSNSGSSGSGNSSGSMDSSASGSMSSGSMSSGSGSESGSGSMSSDSTSNSGSGSMSSDSGSGSSSGSGSDSGSESSSCSGSGRRCKKRKPKTCADNCGCENSNSAGHGFKAPVGLGDGLAQSNHSYLSSAMGSFNLNWNNQYYLNDVRADKLDINFGTGNNWTSSQMPYLLEDSEIYIDFEPGGGGPFRFELGSFEPKFGTRAVLTEESNGDYRLTLENGFVAIFDDETGLIAQTIDTNNVVTDYVNVGEQVEQIRCQFVDGATDVVELRVFDYFKNGPNIGQLQFVTLKRAVGNPEPKPGDFENIRRIEMVYYDADVPGKGSVNDLKLIKQQETVDGTIWTDDKTEYFRYYTDNLGNGLKHGLKYKLSPEEYQNVKLNEGGDPEAVDDLTIADYAGVHFQFNAERQVTHVAQEGGAVANTMTYAPNPNWDPTSDSYNDWYRKATYTTPDGLLKTVYSNEVGGDILIDDQEVSPATGRWIHYFKYDSNGRRIETVRPSAIDMGASPIYDEAVNNLAVQIRLNAGLIELATYYNTTSGGGIANRLESTAVKKGKAGISIKQTETEYYTRSTGSGSEQRTIYPVSKSTVYRSELNGGSQPVTTDYIFEWYTDSLQLSKVTTNLPVVSNLQNGTATNDTTIAEYDPLGRMTKQTDEIGTATTYDYDEGTGARRQMVQDGGPTGLLAITTDYKVDERGRTIEMEGPEHDAGGASNVRTATWTIYKDEYETWTAQGTNEGTAGLLFNPVSISRRSIDGLITDSITATRGAATSTHGRLTETDDFPRSSWVRWSQQRYNDEGRMVASRTYHDIPSFGPGVLGTHYSETTYEYDDVGRQYKVTSPTGTITQTVFDRRDQVVSTWVGTDDSDGTYDDPSGGGSNNMRQVSYNEYDHNVNSQNGNLTKTVQLVNDDSADDRPTNFFYDWRDRQFKTDSTDGTDTFVQESTLDNLGRATVSETIRAGVPSATLIAKSETFFDDRGRTYKSFTYAVSDSGVVGNYLLSETWYDEAGRVIKSSSPGSELFSKTTYDAIGRALITYQAYQDGGADTPASVSGNIVISQTETQYNDASQVLMTTSRERYHDASTTSMGGLDETMNLALARVTYSAVWYDKIGRSEYTANYGTNGDVILVRPSNAPASSDDVLVYQSIFNHKAEVYQTKGPDGHITEMEYDDLGRTTKTTRNFGGSETEVTRQVYNGVGQMIELIAENLDTGQQKTAYAYGVTTSSNGTINNDELHSVTHPDMGVVTYTYNRAGEQILMTDQNGTEHGYVYDQGGRMAEDVVIKTGAGVDGSVRRIVRKYDDRGRLSKVTSYSHPVANIVANEILYEYNGFGQVVKEFQQHAAIASGFSPHVVYGYADGSDNTIRPMFIKYPNGRQVDYDYGVAGSQNDRLSRVENVDDAGGALGGQITTYQYTGNGQIIRAEYAEPDLTYSIPGGVGGYNGLDRFGRIKQLQWEDGGANRVVGFQYGYDRRSNRLFEKDTYLGPVGSKPLKVDALLQYDGLDRVVDFQRGQLNLPNDGISNANLTQDWTLDQTGNWNAFNQTQQVPSVRTLNQTRTHDSVNEITDINQDPGQTIWADPTHDANGNMTAIPYVDETVPGSYEATWDAWNRLVELTDNGEVVAAYQYDGTNRRIVVADNATIGGIDAGFLASDIVFIPEQWNGTFNAGEFDATGSYFTTEAGTVNIGDINRGIGVDDNATGSGFLMYSAEDVHSRFTVNQYNADHLVAVRLNGTQWQYNTNAAWVNFTPVSSDRLLAEVDFSANTVSNRGWRRVYYSLSAQALEERLGSQVHQQYVWGLRFVDDLILRDRDTADNGTLDERLYAMHDLRFSIVAVANASGVVQERYTYDAYGIRTVMDALFVDQASTTVDWQFAYTGRRLDSATGLYFFRARYYSAELGRFIGRDPLGFVDGMNLYRGYFVPISVDPSGAIVIFVHGIGSSQHRTHSKIMFSGLESAWAKSGHSNQAYIHFLYGPADTKDAWRQDTTRNTGAAAQLKALVSSLQSERTRLNCKEPIFIYAYSNGTTVTTFALEAGMTVDGVVFAGGSLENDHKMTKSLAGTPWLKSYWSPQDNVAGWADGIGEFGFSDPKIYPKISEVEFKNISHYRDDNYATASNPTRLNGYSEWDSRFMAVNYYAADLATKAKCCISFKGTVTDSSGAKLTFADDHHYFDSGIK